MKNYLVPFAIAIVIFSITFLGLDFAIMKLQGLSLFFNP